jgi:hypothetical protein
MCKNHLRKQQMSPAVLSADAKDKLHDLVHARSRGPGDWMNAIERLARELAVPHAKLWAVLYRPPKDISASVYLAILAAHQRQERRFNDVRQTTRIAGPVSAALHRLAAAVAGEDCGE